MSVQQPSYDNYKVFLFYDEIQPLCSVGRLNYNSADKSPKTTKLYSLLTSNCYVTNQPKKNKDDSKSYNKFGGRWLFTAVAAVPPTFLHSFTLSIPMTLIIPKELLWDSGSSLKKCLNVKLELALATIHKCLTLLHDDLGPDTKELWLIKQTNKQTKYVTITRKVFQYELGNFPELKC